MSRYVLFLSIIILLSSECKQSYSNLSKSQTERTIDSITNRLDSFYFINKPALAQAVLDSLRPIAEVSDNFYITFTFLHFCGKAKNFVHQADSAKFYYRKALTLAQQNDTSLILVNDAKLWLGNEFEEEKIFDSALLYTKEAYLFYKSRGLKKLDKACLNLAELYDDVNDQPMFRKYLFEGYQITQDRYLKMRFANDISVYYDQHEMEDSGISFFFAHVLPDTLICDPKQYISLKLNEASFLMAKGNLLEAQKGYFSVLKKYRELGEINQPIIYQNIGLIYQKLKQYKQSNIYLDSAIVICVNAKNIKLQANALYVKAQNNFYSQNIRRAYSLMDSSYWLFAASIDSSYAKQAEELDKKYSIRAKDNEIDKLAIASKAAQKEAKLYWVLIITLIIGLALLLLLMFVLLGQRKLRNTNERLEAEKKKIVLEQRLLRTQIEPHFIFNSLTVLQAQIQNGENEKAGKYLNQFAKLLRASLENSRENFVDLVEEIDALQNYCSLQAMRFEDLFEYNIIMYEGYIDDAVFIPPMLLQPFVENAILHGMKAIAYKGKINISIRKENGMLHCIIEDNGKGRTTAQSSKNQKSLSTAITQERLSILSNDIGKQSSLNIIDKIAPSTGTLVEIIFPYKIN